MKKNQSYLSHRKGINSLNSIPCPFILLICCYLLQADSIHAQSFTPSSLLSSDAAPKLNIQKVDTVRPYPNLTGLWYWEGRPIGRTDVIRNGNIAIYLQQTGANLTGQLIQINSPQRKYEYNARPVTGPLVKYDALVEGTIYGKETSSGNLLFFLRRIQTDGKHMALFTGVISSDSSNIDGWFVNTWDEGGKGIFVMRRADTSLIKSDEADRSKIEQLTKQFEKDLINKDSLALLQLYLTPGTPVTNKGKDRIQTQSASDFVVALTRRKNKVSETFHEKAIDVDGSTATLSAQYHWSVEGVLKDKGQVRWLLVKVGDDWKIVHHLWMPLKQ